MAQNHPLEHDMVLYHPLSITHALSITIGALVQQVKTMPVKYNPITQCQTNTSAEASLPFSFANFLNKGLRAAFPIGHVAICTDVHRGGYRGHWRRRGSAPTNKRRDTKKDERLVFLS